MKKDRVVKIRLQDANLREGRDDPKRVYLCVDRTSRDAWIEISFVEVSEETQKRFEFLKGALSRLSEEGIAVPTVKGSKKTENELSLKVSYEGVGLLEQLKNKEISGEIDLTQVTGIFRKMDQIEKEKGEFITPRPIERFFELMETDAFKEEHEEKILNPLRELQERFEKFLDSFASKYRYGWGVIDPDIINFTAKGEAGDGDYKVSLIDIDGLRGSYDFYYQAGYFWTSLERLSDQSLIESKRKEFKAGFNFDGMDARKRFRLGKVAAMSILLFSEPKEMGQDNLRARIDIIDNILAKNSTSKEG